MSIELSDASKTLFVALIKDAGNWSGSPLWGGNIGGSKKDNGNLMDLKKKGLLVTEQDDENKKCQWVHFTKDGVNYASSLVAAGEFDAGYLEELSIQ